MPTYWAGGAAALTVGVVAGFVAGAGLSKEFVDMRSGRISSQNRWWIELAHMLQREADEETSCSIISTSGPGATGFPR